MKFQEQLPLPLTKIAEDLKGMGLDATVQRAKVEYDESVIGTDVVLTLTITIADIYKERNTPEDAFDAAMGIL